MPPCYCPPVQHPCCAPPTCKLIVLVRVLLFLPLVFWLIIVSYFVCSTPRSSARGGYIVARVHGARPCLYWCELCGILIDISDDAPVCIVVGVRSAVPGCLVIGVRGVTPDGIVDMTPGRIEGRT